MRGNASFQIEYDHKLNLHTVLGAKTVLQQFFAAELPNSLLDVGCGAGTWLRAALDLGVREVLGIDGVSIDPGELLVSDQFFRLEDLSEPIDLGRRFDVVLCLEVAEHLAAAAASRLIATLVVHSDLIFFSAAVPGQKGQSHINCQWPSCWQNLFNEQGYACGDDLRWKIWDLKDIEPWYRQNVFVATRAPDLAGKEPRLRSVIHPDMLGIKVFDTFAETEKDFTNRIEAGSKSVYWYAILFPKAVAAKVRRRLPRLLHFGA